MGLTVSELKEELRVTKKELKAARETNATLYKTVKLLSNSNDMSENLKKIEKTMKQIQESNQDAEILKRIDHLTVKKETDCGTRNEYEKKIETLKVNLKEAKQQHQEEKEQMMREFKDCKMEMEKKNADLLREKCKAAPGTTVICGLCWAVIDLEGRNGPFVVKCDSCQEGTPIRPAPNGKKYYRCPCNCLLITSVTSMSFYCPRPNCLRMITL